MRHFLLASTVTPLSSGVIATASERLLIGAPCTSGRLTASDPGALPGTIDLSTIAPSADHQQVTVDVIDTGLGIPPEIKEHIFDPFFTTNPDGTGLGLAITKRIIVAHNGKIEVVDSAGAGTA